MSADIAYQLYPPQWLPLLASGCDAIILCQVDELGAAQP